MADLKHTRIFKKEFQLKAAVVALLVASISIVYAQVGTFAFVSFDDPMYVRDNPLVRQGLSWEGVKWAFTVGYASNWHPLTWISHMADVELFGMNPGMHHLTNVLIHSLNSILLFLVLSRLTGALWRSALVAALFALHPVHVESVAWISERKDVLSGLFWMLTLWAYSCYVRRRTVLRYALVASAFALGLMAKPMLVTLPLVLLLLDFWPLQRVELIPPGEGLRPAGTPPASRGRVHGEARGNISVDAENASLEGRPRVGPSRNPGISPQGTYRLFLEKMPLIVMSLAVSAVTFHAQAAGGSVSPLERLPLADRVMNALSAYVLYLGKTIWPLNLSAFYPYPKHFSALALGGCVLLIAAITLLAVRAAGSRPYLLTGWLWYLVTLIPVIGIVQVGSQSMADRYTYIPLIGIFLVAAWGLNDLVGRRRTTWLASGAASISLLMVLAWTAWSQAGTWKDSETLFTHALTATRDNYLAHNSLGVALFDRGEVDAAMGHYRESLRLKPDYVNAHCNLGVAFARKKLYMQALAQYRECLRIDPGYAEAHYNMGVAFSDMGRTEEAIGQYREAIRGNPGHENAHNNLGFLLAGQGKLGEAVRHYSLALESNPYNVRARVNLVDALVSQGMPDKALARLKEALAIDSGNPELYVKQAEILINKGDAEKAAASYRSALAQDPGSPRALYGLAVIYAGQERFGEALAILDKLAGLRPGDPAIDYNIACIHARQGNAGEALKALRNAVRKGFKDGRTLRTDPDLESIRGEKAFTELLKHL